MNDADRVHHLLTIAADPPGPPVMPPDLIPRARRRNRRRQLGVLGTALGGLGLVGSLAALHDSERPATLAQPLSVPAALHAAAPVRSHGGPMPPQQRLCRVRDVGGDAQLTQSRNGVLGVVRLHGTGCSLRVDAGSIVLLDPAGHALNVPWRTESNLNPGAVARPDFAQGRGDVSIGFAWRGSWCGERATRLRLTAVTSPKTIVVVPIAGRPPACSSGAPAGYLVPGLVGGSDDAVQTAPPAWGALRATLILPASTSGHADIPYRVVLNNTGDVPVTLTPCPRFDTVVAGDTLASPYGVAGYLIIGGGGAGGALPCGQVLRPGRSLDLPLRFDYELSYGRFAPGLIRVEWAMAGVPTASGTVRVR